MVTIDAALVRWSTDEAERAGRPLLVLLHGVGSHEGDLIGLAPYLPRDLAIASLRAPLPHGDGHSWYPLALPGSPEPGPVDEAAEAVLAWVDSLGDAHPSVALLGFSQGGSLTLQLLRHAPERFAWAAVLAGFVVPDDSEATSRRDAELARVRPDVFWGRGDVDAVIPLDAVQRTADWLAAHADVEETVYPGLAHGISQEELDDLNAFISRVTNPLAGLDPDTLDSDTRDTGTDVAAADRDAPDRAAAPAPAAPTATAPATNPDAPDAPATTDDPAVR
ncbi:dienelactone hydrolase family protein [Frigoribacterium sp. CFBP 8754]|uniref:alpha/beta hydrolase n=1 Tax=Frigoribacterium sp. CFBP 8754 TaxID=2775290 RepID=UPI0017869038|nr:alpha/beta hydrolase-fold protein [Frigoribacterium sp. CFBP 8754]MBD8661207.1 dienelactone hydrolase family protein [Frigoribacterium sp. CFBP 8754]